MAEGSREDREKRTGPTQNAAMRCRSERNDALSVRNYSPAVPTSARMAALMCAGSAGHASTTRASSRQETTIGPVSPAVSGGWVGPEKTRNSWVFPAVGSSVVGTSFRLLTGLL